MKSPDEIDSTTVKKPKKLFPFFHWLFCWKSIRAGCFILACLATFWGLFHVEENWRGKRAWENYKSDLESKGQWYDGAALIPPTVPDDQNFAMTPCLAGLYQYSPGKPINTNAYQRASQGLPNFPSGSWNNGIALDLSQCLKEIHKAKKQPAGNSEPDILPGARTELARQILEEMKSYDGLLSEIEKASQLPLSRFNIHYEQDNKLVILLPHLAYIKMYCGAFATRASARLALGQTDQAFEDVNLIFCLADKIKNEPIFISHAVRMVCMRNGLQPVWEGLANHQWSEKQIKSLQERFEKLDILNDVIISLRAERDFFSDSIFLLFRKGFIQGASSLDMNQSPSQSMSWLLRILIPKGWIYFEELNCHKLLTQRSFSAYDLTARLVRPDVDRKNKDAVNAQFGGVISDILGHRRLAKLIIGDNDFTIKPARSQNSLDLAVVACGLELHKMALGQYPEKLDALVPRFVNKLPSDIVNGQPLKYHCTKDGRFLLYSIGWDLKDDNGKSERRAAFEGNSDGDWVWKYSSEKDSN